MRLQLGEVIKQKKMALTSPSGSVQGEVSDEGSIPLESSREEDPQRRPRRKRMTSSNSNALELKLQNLKANLIHMSSLSGYTL